MLYRWRWRAVVLLYRCRWCITDCAFISAEEDPWLATALLCTDGAGVPLTVLLSDRTLKDGVCSVRSRDTLLSQQVHVSQLTELS